MDIKRSASNKHFLPVCEQIESLIECLTVKMRNSDRHFRFLVCNRILDCAWELHAKLARAGRVNPKVRVLSEAIVLHDSLRSQVRVAYNIGAIKVSKNAKSRENTMKRVSAIGASIGAWYKQEQGKEEEKKNRKK